jgi:hypothetical protein
VQQFVSLEVPKQTAMHAKPLGYVVSARLATATCQAEASQKSSGVRTNSFVHLHSRTPPHVRVKHPNEETPNAPIRLQITLIAKRELKLQFCFHLQFGARVPPNVEKRNAATHQAESAPKSSLPGTPSGLVVYLLVITRRVNFCVRSGRPAALNCQGLHMQIRSKT